MTYAANPAAHRKPQGKVAEYLACPACRGVVESTMTICPTCRRWLGPGRLPLWRAMVLVGALTVVIAFYFPWIDGASGANASGQDLARQAEMLARGGSSRPVGTVSLALYLVPVGGLAALILMIVAQVRRWSLVFTGRLIVAFAAMPAQVTILAAALALLHVADGPVQKWPHVGLFAAVLGSLMVVVGGIVLGGPGRAVRFPRWFSESIAGPRPDRAEAPETHRA